MDREEKLRLLQQQIDEASGGKPADFNLWREKTDVVLRNVLGEANPLCIRFGGISYGLGVFTLDTPQSAWDRARETGVQEAIAILEAAKLEVEVAAPAPGAPGAADARQTVFLVHGRDEARKHETARFLALLTGNEPVILHEQANEGRTIIEKFEDHAAEAGYAVVLLTSDDVGRAAAEADEHPRARQNVVFELGFFFGALGRRRVAMLYDEAASDPQIQTALCGSRSTTRAHGSSLSPESSMQWGYQSVGQHCARDPASCLSKPKSSCTTSLSYSRRSTSRNGRL